MKAGFTSACWRSPIIQQLIYERFGVFYNVFYLAQLLKHLGFSYQKAAFVSDHLNEAKRQEWCTTTWPQILTLAKAQHALLLFGDEASFPQWGTLSYTWAHRKDLADGENIRQTQRLQSLRRDRVLHRAVLVSRPGGGSTLRLTSPFSHASWHRPRHPSC